MYRVYKVGGILMGVYETLSEAKYILTGTDVGWVTLNGAVVFKKTAQDGGL